MAKKCLLCITLDKNIPCDFIKLKEIKKEDIFSFLVFFYRDTVQFVLDLVEIGPAVLEKMFKFHQCIFPNFIIISPCTRIWPFIWTTLNLLYSSIFVSTLVSIGRVVLEKSFLLLKLFSLSKTIFWNINKRIQPNLPSRRSILCLCATSTVILDIRL